MPLSTASAACKECYENVDSSDKDVNVQLTSGLARNVKIVNMATWEAGAWADGIPRCSASPPALARSHA